MKTPYVIASVFTLLASLIFTSEAISGTPRALRSDVIVLERSSRPLFHKVKLFAAGSVPLGEFGNSNPNASGSGFAYPGVGGGADYSQEVIKHVGFAVTGMFVVHGYDVSGWKEIIPYWHWDGDSRVVFALTGGVLFDLDLSPSVNVYGTAQAGILHVNYPNLTLRDQLGEMATLLAASQRTAAFKLSLGTTVNKFDVSVQFLYGEPEFQATYQYRFEKTVFLPEKLPVRAVMATIGLVLN